MGDINDANDSRIEPLLAEGTLENILALLADDLPPAPLETSGEHTHPFEDEQALYYYGLPGNPRLIARTGTTKWDPLMHGPRGREIYPKRQIVYSEYAWKLKGYMQDGHFKTQLDCALDGIDGMDRESIDFMTICSGVRYRNDDNMAYVSDGPNYPYRGKRPEKYKDPIRPAVTVLVVTTDSASIPWSKAIDAARRCRAVLKENGIHDVECEVKGPQTAEGMQLVASIEKF